ncbi:MAG: M28 family peptidase [Chloroflexi bacterium]|nr:M28 family peptidase [Chloroflexota bacterium]
MIPTARPATRPSRPRRLGAWARLVPGLALCLLLVGCLGREAQAPTEATATAVEPAEASPEAAATEAGTGLGDYGEGDLISGARQLIFEGLRSGEGYFSADGRKLIYQAEREADNPFYQIYLLDLETGDNTLVSTGVGKTSCAWIHPDGDKVLFASTQDDPEAEAKMAEEFRLREEETGRRYEWNYDATFEIYQKDLATGEYTNLTNALGYDAEGSWSPDGSRIAFASNRLAYAEPMSPEDQERFDFDNGYMADIYIMDADGGNLQRLTDAPGYDGGPFFSPDGSRIVYRHFNETGELAEIWSMATDGSDKRQLTHLGAMSWAPFYHPSGKYIVFTTSLHGFANFEIYMVDVEGTKEPLRVTFTDGPDVLPVFSPDGKQITWSTRRGGAGSQQWIADWNHDEALALLDLAPAQGSVAYAGGEGDLATADLSATTAEITAEDARLHVEALSGDAMAGRLTGTPGEAAATEYVAEAFEAIGLAPAGSDGYYQPFEFTSGVAMGEPNVLSITLPDGSELEPVVDVDWRPLAFSKPNSAGFGDLVFAGYGINAPADGDQPAYDSYGDLDVEGKWVVALRYLPENVTPERRQHLGRYASLRFKAMEARDRGAVGILIVSGPASQVKEQLVPLKFDASVSGTAIHAASISDDLAQQLFAAAGQDLAAAQAALDAGEVVPGFVLGDASGTAQAGAHFTLAFETSTGRNTVGRLQIGDAPSDEVVILGAHVDHLGHGEGGDSLARADEEGQIHHGADDNASGVAGLIEIAQQMAAREAAGELPEEARDLVFVAWSGEELGLLGSNHFVKAMKAELGEPETLSPPVAAYLNMDMIGRLTDKLVLQGVGSSDFWKPEIEKRNVPIGLPLGLSDDTYLPTDATSFYLAGVPILSAFTGAHEDYHSPRDTADKIDYADLAKIARLVGSLAQDVATAETAPDYLTVAPSGDGENRRVGHVYLGTIPDYAESGVEGMLLSGVSAEGPAAEAGIQSGDVIVELAGQAIANIYDYTRVLDSLKIGQAVGVVVLRDGEKVTLEITPASRD